MNAEGFDPYRVWLNIREQRRPLSAYQLLGLASLEDNVDRINKAAAQQRGAMELHRFEAHPTTWRQVNQELEDAIATLTDPQRKAAYDAALKGVGSQELSQRNTAASVARSHSGALHCAHCGAANPPTRKFCGACGKNLWEACPTCGTLSLAGERYCGACGAHFASNMQRLIEQFEANLDKADSLRREFRYEEAMTLLTAMLAVEHSYLAGHMLQAKRLQEQIALERDQLVARADGIQRDVEAMVARYELSAALEALEKIPGPLRKPDVEALYQDLRAKTAEVASLEQAIEEAVREKRSGDALAKLRRLLEIKPDHLRARTLSHQFGEMAARVAERRLAQCRYEEAFRLLRQLPESELTERTRALFLRVRDLVWSIRHIRSAPYADPTLVAIVRRLREMVPGDPQVARWHEEIHRRTAAAAKQAKFTVAAIARAPETSYCGVPVDWLTGFRRIDEREVRENAAFVEHPGSYYVAAGLALHGLGQSSLEINLLPESGGMWGRLAKSLPKRSVNVAWGIDLGSRALKAVRVAFDEKSKTATLKACDFVEYKKVLSQSADEAEAQGFLKESLATFGSRNSLRGDRVCLGLPGSMVLSRMLALPPMPPDRLDSAIRYEARQQFPNLHGELVLGYHMLEKMEGDLQSRRDHEVLLVVARRARLESLLKACREAGIAVDAVLSDCLALHDFLRFDHLPDARRANLPSAVLPALAVLDIGADATNFVVSSPRVAWHRVIALGTEQLTKTLARDFDLGFAEAEKLLREPATAPSLSKLYDALEPAFEDFVEEIQRSLDAFNRMHRRQRVEMILGLGGGLQFHGLLKYLRCGPMSWEADPSPAPARPVAAQT